MGKTLASNVHIDGTVYPAGSEPPADVAKRITNPKAWAAGDDADEAPAAGEPITSGYGDHKVGELKTEIARRNASRPEADALSAEGNKAALVAVLEADDAASA